MTKEEFWDVWTLNNDIRMLNSIAKISVEKNISKTKEQFFLSYCLNILRGLSPSINTSDVSPEWFLDRLIAYSYLAEQNDLSGIHF